MADLLDEFLEGLVDAFLLFLFLSELLRRLEEDLDWKGVWWTQLCPQDRVSLNGILIVHCQGEECVLILEIDLNFLSLLSILEYGISHYIV